MALILDGSTLANQIQDEIRDRVAQFVEYSGIRPCLAVVLTTSDPASQIYVRKKQEACERAGIRSILYEPFRTGVPRLAQTELNNLICILNERPDVHGILVQLPLPNVIDKSRVFSTIDPLKDVDVLHPENAGLMALGVPRYLSCTPHAVMQILKRNNIDVLGKRVAIINSSNIVGKPLQSMMLQEGATTTICHDRTTHSDLKEICLSSDIVVVAVGIPKFITEDMIQPGTVVVDVGINRVGKKLVGDVDFEPVAKIAGSITPVPGGIGPLTVAMLLQNTLEAAELSLEC